MKYSSSFKSNLTRFAVENIGIVVFGTLVPLLGLLSDFFVGKEALFGVVAGLYVVPPLVQLVQRILNAPARAATDPKGLSS